MRDARIRDPDEQDQREGDERDSVEEVEPLERLKVLMGARDDEARNGRAEAETEVACDSSEGGRYDALLHWYQGQGENLARSSHEPEAGTSDGRVDKALPRMVDKCEGPVAERVHDIAGDENSLRAETVEQRTRWERHHRGRSHDRPEDQAGSRRREAADGVEIDDLERQEQSRAEVVEGVPALQNEDRSR